MSAPLFVYGTLMRGEASHALLAGAPFLGDATTAARFTLVDLGAYPALVEGGSSAVQGELYASSAELLAVLDAFEEHPRVYRRAAIELAGGGAAEAYVLPAQLARGRPAIAGGDWRGRRSSGA